MTEPTAPTPTGRTVFRTGRLLPHPPAEVYRAFSRPALLARWWGPRGFTNTFQAFDFRPGGAWRLVMHGPDGTHHPNECRFREMRAPESIVIEHLSAPRFVLTVTLSPQDDKTNIEWVQEFEDADVAERLGNIIEPANEQNLDRLATVLASAASGR